MSFDADSLQMVSMVTSGVGALVGAVGATQTGQANYQAATYQSAVAQNNQTIAEQNARYALEAGRSQESAQREKTAQMIGMQRAQMAANGIDIGSGSALNVQASTAATGELDALTIRNNAARAAYNYNVQAGDFAANAKLADMTAANATKTGGINAVSSIVGDAGSVADKWLKWKMPSNPINKSFTDWGVNY